MASVLNFTKFVFDELVKEVKERYGVPLQSKSVDELMVEQWSYLNLDNANNDREQELIFLKQFVKKMRQEGAADDNNIQYYDFMKSVINMSDEKGDIMKFYSRKYEGDNPLLRSLHVKLRTLVHAALQYKRDKRDKRDKRKHEGSTLHEVIELTGNEKLYANSGESNAYRVWYREKLLRKIEKDKRRTGGTGGTPATSAVDNNYSVTF
jgi:hypothetical protein